MSLVPGWRRAVRSESVDREVDEEIAFHLAMREEKLRAEGMPEDRARAAALERFGDRDRVREHLVTADRRYTRRLRLGEWLASVGGDFRLALRILRKTPVFTVAAAATLALGIAASTAMFSLVDGILLRPLPYPDAERLVRVTQKYPEIGLDSWGLSQQNVAQYRDRAQGLASFAAFTRAGRTLEGNGQPERLSIVRATGDFFDVLGVPPLLGHTFGRAQDTPQTNNVAVLSYGLWQTRFAGDPAIVGKVLRLDGQPTTVLGVMPNGFAFPRPDAQLYVPVGLDPTRGFGFIFTGVGRLARGATITNVERSATSVMWDWARARSGMVSGAGVDPSNTHMAAVVVPLREAITRDSKRPLQVLQAAVVVILLIAIANVATLLSSRSGARVREVAMRNALGATRGRVMRQLLTESVALAAVGAVLGVALAYLLVRLVTHASVVSLPRIAEVGVNGRVLAFALVTTLVAGIAFGLGPALSLLDGRLFGNIAGGSKSSMHVSARRFNNTLVAAQVALSIVLLISAGLVLKSFRRLLATDLGFEPAAVTTLAVPLPVGKYQSMTSIANAGTQIIDRARAVPGVSDAALAWYFPFSGNTNRDAYLVQGRPVPAAGAEAQQTVQVAISPAFFSTLRIPLRFGRDFARSDDSASMPVAIVDEALASQYWRGADALGKRVRLGGDTTWWTIVGVAGSVRDVDVATEPAPHLYFPFSQRPDARPMLAVRTGNAGALAGVRRAIQEVEPGIPLDNIRPLDTWISNALDTRRITEILLVGFAILAALLASVGIYGVMSLYVANRGHEFGVRLAIGGQPGHLLSLVMREGLRLAVAGVAVGLLGAAAATRWLATLLYQVSATDPVVYASLAVGLLAVTALSCYIPAHRATRSDPLVALRAQ